MSELKIKVTFIDDASGQSIGATYQETSAIPDSFEVKTTLTIGGNQWSVVHASPTTRAEYERSKILTLRLRKIELIDPKDILFSLPSICDPIPAIGNDPTDGTEFVIEDDDWRQLEFVSNALRSEVDQELAGIRLIHENDRVKGSGWRKIHVRKGPLRPILSKVTLDELWGSLRDSGCVDHVAYSGYPMRIANAYSLRMNDGARVYGVASGGIVEVIAIDQYSVSSASSGSIAELKSLALGLNLDLVRWCRCGRAGPNDPLFELLLER